MIDPWLRLLWSVMPANPGTMVLYGLIGLAILAGFAWWAAEARR